MMLLRHTLICVYNNDCVTMDLFADVTFMLITLVKNQIKFRIFI